jgi:hypothetical protein
VESDGTAGTAAGTVADIGADKAAETEADTAADKADTTLDELPSCSRTLKLNPEIALMRQSRLKKDPASATE